MAAPPLQFQTDKIRILCGNCLILANGQVHITLALKTVTEGTLRPLAYILKGFPISLSGVCFQNRPRDTESPHDITLVPPDSWVFPWIENGIYLEELLEYVFRQQVVKTQFSPEKEPFPVFPFILRMDSGQRNTPMYHQRKERVSAGQ